MGLLKEAIAKLNECFNKYAGQDGDNTTMSKAEVANMFKAELPELVDAFQNDSAGKCKPPEKVAELFKMLDSDGDGTVDFCEFVVFVATICMVCHN